MPQDIPFTNRLVRDLAWTIGSPPLCCRHDPGVVWQKPDWFAGLATQFSAALQQLDADPQPLAQALEPRKDRRLGHYHERLWQYWLKHNDRYRLLHANLPVRDRHRTIGEFDLLVEDRFSGKTLHWELAVKFYLGSGDTAEPQHWWGPGQRDRLDIKTRHMLEHQIRLQHEPAARLLLTELGIHIDESWLLLKGRLFYHTGTNAVAPEHGCPDHLRGFWVTASEFAEAFDGRRLLQLERHQWLAPLQGVNMDYTADSRTILAGTADYPVEFPLCLAVIEDGRELTRGFMVPDAWETRLHQDARG